MRSRVGVALVGVLFGCFSEDPAENGDDATTAMSEPTTGPAATMTTASTSDAGDSTSTGATDDDGDPDSTSGGAGTSRPGDVLQTIDPPFGIGGIADLGSGDLAVLGVFTGDLTLGGATYPNPSGRDLLVARMSEDGEVALASHWDGAADVFPLAFAAVPRGRIALVVAYATGLATPDAVALPQPPRGIEWVAVGVHDVDTTFLQAHVMQTESTYTAGIDADSSDRIAVAVSHLGPALVSGQPELPANGIDAALWRIEQDGSTSSLVSFGSTGSDQVTGLVYDGLALGPTRIVGEFSGTIDTDAGSMTAQALTDAFVAAVEADGSLAWGRRIGGDGEDLARGVAVDASGSVYVFAHYGDGLVPERTEGAPVPGAGDSDLVLQKYDASGVLQWRRTWGGPGEEQARALAVHDGVVVAVGDMRGETDYDGAIVSSEGGTDALVIAVDADDGELRWVDHFGAANDDRALSVVVTDAGAWVHLAFQGEVDVGGTVFGRAGEFHSVLASFEP